MILKLRKKYINDKIELYHFFIINIESPESALFNYNFSKVYHLSNNLNIDRKYLRRVADRDIDAHWYYFISEEDALKIAKVSKLKLKNLKKYSYTSIPGRFPTMEWRKISRNINQLYKFSDVIEASNLTTEQLKLKKIVEE